MTREQFQRDEASQARLRELLSDPVMRAAMDILRGEYEGRDSDTNAPEVASVRALSMRAGFDSYPIKLRQLTEAPITAAKPLKETWGTEP